MIMETNPERGSKIRKDVFVDPSPEATRARIKRDTYYRVVAALGGKWRMVPVLATLLLICGFFYSQEPIFLSPRNISFLAVQIVVTSTVALGLFFVLVIGEIDLAVVANAAVAAAFAALLATESALNPLICILIAVLLGAGIGALEAFVVTLFKAPSFIVSLGFSLILAGGLLQLLPGSGVILLVGNQLADISNTYLPTWISYGLVMVFIALFAGLRWSGQSARYRVGLPRAILRSVALPTIALGVTGCGLVLFLGGYQGVPTPVAVLLILLTFCGYLTRQTSFGLHLYAIGSSSEAARRAGISVNRVRIVAFMLAGGLAALGGVIGAGRVLAVSGQSADGTLLLEAIAAAVIGGASLFGGRGSVWSALLGALVIGSISNGMLLINATTQVRLAVEGLVLVIAVVVDASITRLGSRE